MVMGGIFSKRGHFNPILLSSFFFLPFVLLALIIIHLIFLHQGGSNNPVGGQTPEKVPFHPFFTSKDLRGFLFVFFLFMLVIFYCPNLFSDAENFNPANPIITPVHIQPE